MFFWEDALLDVLDGHFRPKTQEAKGWLMSEKLYCQKTTIPNKTFKAKKMTIEKWEAALMHNEILMEISTGRNVHLRNYFICVAFSLPTTTYKFAVLVCVWTTDKAISRNQKWIYLYILWKINIDIKNLGHNCQLGIGKQDLIGHKE